MCLSDRAYLGNPNFLRIFYYFSTLSIFGPTTMATDRVSSSTVAVAAARKINTPFGSLPSLKRIDEKDTFFLLLSASFVVEDFSLLPLTELSRLLQSCCCCYCCRCCPISDSFPIGIRLLVLFTRSIFYCIQIKNQIRNQMYIIIFFNSPEPDKCHSMSINV